MRTYERSWWWVKQKKKMALVLITITMILQFQTKGCVGCVETERMGLLQLKSYFNSLLIIHENSTLDSWSDDDPKSNCCTWESVQCSDAIGGHIVQLLLSKFNLPSEEMDLNPPQIALNLSLLQSFPKLKYLDFSSNGISHLFNPIHGYKSFQTLKNLEILNLSDNYLNNSVLPFLSAARSLRILYLGYNRLKGVFPPNGLINLRELEELDLSSNSINDFEAGDGLKTMKLKTLYLRRNKFSDTVRLKGLINFMQLEELDLSSNNMSDFEAGDGLRTMTLKTLDLRCNNFSDAAQLRSLKGLVELRVLNLAENKFTDLYSLCAGLVVPPSLRVLNLNDNQLSSTHKGYSKLCGLKNLRELHLSNNALTNMPYCLGNLSRLQILDLTDNQMNGDLSAFVSGLPSALEYVSLFRNSFNGSFLFSSFVNQTRLKVLLFSSKVGMIQAQAESFWVPLFQLKVLRLQNFILGSTVPHFLLHQHDLWYVNLSHNKLTGAFPTWLVQNNTRLQTLLLNSNSLTELQLPKVVHGLKFLDISGNRIYDSIQEDMGIFFQNLSLLNFSSNYFYGTIPSSMGKMKSLEMLDISSNNLSGKLSKTFSSGWYSITYLKLSNNQFCGKMFLHENVIGLLILLLDGNYFTGCIGKGLTQSKSLLFLDISDNRLSGNFPLWIERMSTLSYINMSGNQLKGPFPHQLQIQWLEVLDMSHNSFSGPIPRNVSISSRLQVLRLQNNEFSGSIPDTLFKSEVLKILDLRNNNFSGKILNIIGERSTLLALLLRNNSLQSHIPEEICQLSKIGFLDLSHNKFKGVIPSCIGNMSFGAESQDVVLSFFSSGGYTGASSFYDYYSTPLYLDDTLHGYSASMPQTIVDFSTKSRYEAYQGDILHYMSGMDLSSNELSGEIPVEIGNLQSIRSLNFSSNNLTGSIPGSVSKIKDLESLDLSNNMLNGSIPPALAELNSLGYFNVSCNNLSGEIPFKGHLTFEEKSYIGNAHLCGLPTNISCNPEKAPEPSASLQGKEEEDGVIDMVWFYWTCGAVYISTSFALFAFLCIDSRWSREWFYRVDLLVHHLQPYKCSSFGN